MNRIAERQKLYNEATKESWSIFASHREAVSRELTQTHVREDGRLCILGAGNCNDVDLPHLEGLYREVHLVDLDATALCRARDRIICDSSKIYLHGGIDLSGITNQLVLFERGSSPPDETQIMMVRQKAESATVPLPSSSFDVVVSTCVLTQLICAVGLSLPSTDPHALQLAFSVRDRHLQIMAQLLKPGGLAVLVTDFASSMACPEIECISESEFPTYCRDVIERGCFFPGANPLALVSRLRQYPQLSCHVMEVRLTKPWRWTMDRRTFAVCANSVSQAM